MGKKVKYLPDAIKFAAICNQIEAGNAPEEDIDIGASATNGNFSWLTAKQGSTFWETVDNSFWTLSKVPNATDLDHLIHRD